MSECESECESECDSECESECEFECESECESECEYYRVLNYVLSCVLANSKVSPLWLRQTGEKSSSPAWMRGSRVYRVLNSEKM